MARLKSAMALSYSPLASQSLPRLRYEDAVAPRVFCAFTTVDRARRKRTGVWMSRIAASGFDGPGNAQMVLRWLASLTREMQETPITFSEKYFRSESLGVERVNFGRHSLGVA